MKVIIDIPDLPERELYTGRTLIAVDPDRPAEEILNYVDNFQRATRDVAGPAAAKAFSSKTKVWLRLGAAVVETPPEPMRAFMADVRNRGETARSPLDGAITAPEHFLYPPRKILLAPDPFGPSSRDILEVLGVREEHTGRVRVLVLDAGFDDQHPDFAGRCVQRRSFVTDEPDVDDLTGHGTHCAGLVGGPRVPFRGPRYGVAPDATIIAGRVMGRATKSAVDGAVIDALQWAMENDIAVVNMSFGVDVDFGAPFNAAFEAVARRALNNGVLLVAAAGNDPLDARHPVEHPANCPSVMAVAALDGDLRPAAFSCVSRNQGQNVDVAAPGYLVRSSFRGDYAALSGTSMAAALVSGVAALWAETSPCLRGEKLWNQIVGSNPNQSLLPPQQAGAGLVQAPLLPVAELVEEQGLAGVGMVQAPRPR